jgi:hypothetical protein
MMKILKNTMTNDEICDFDTLIIEWYHNKRTEGLAYEILRFCKEHNYTDYPVSDIKQWLNDNGFN